MEESDICAPLYYVIGREGDSALFAAADVAFSVTPCNIGVVANEHDKHLIKHVVEDMYLAADEAACEELSAHTARTHHRPVLTVGKGEELTAVFADGERQTICSSKLTATN
jgi:hypothetical protein